VDQRRVSVAVAVSIATIAVASCTAAYRVPESDDSSRPWTPGSEPTVPTTVPA
jgi:hypothetical protein